MRMRLSRIRIPCGRRCHRARRTAGRRRVVVDTDRTGFAPARKALANGGSPFVARAGLQDATSLQYRDGWVVGGAGRARGRAGGAFAPQRPAADRPGPRDLRVGCQRRLHRADRRKADRRRLADAPRIPPAGRPVVRRSRRAGGATALAELPRDSGSLRSHLRCVRSRLGDRSCVRGSLDLLSADRRLRRRCSRRWRGAC